MAQRPVEGRAASIRWCLMARPQIRGTRDSQVYAVLRSLQVQLTLFWADHEEQNIIIAIIFVMLPCITTILSSSSCCSACGAWRCCYST